MTASAIKTRRVSKTDENTNALTTKTSLYTLGEEIANAVTHGIGAALSVAALVLLIVRAACEAPSGSVGGYVVGYTVFGASLLLLYLISTLYHALPVSKAKRVFARLDHSAIFVLIAGTYTAFCLGPICSGAGWWLFGTIWGLAIVGIVAYSVYEKRASLFTQILYLVMGWFVVLVVKQLGLVIPQISFTMLVAGGLSYTIGVAFFAMKKIRWMHSVWHLFVLGGSVLHFFSLYWAI